MRRFKNRFLIEVIWLAMAALDRGTYVLKNGYKLTVD
jgi:hypothetical protein